MSAAHCAVAPTDCAALNPPYEVRGLAYSHFFHLKMTYGSAAATTISPMRQRIADTPTRAPACA